MKYTSLCISYWYFRILAHLVSVCAVSRISWWKNNQKIIRYFIFFCTQNTFTCFLMFGISKQLTYKNDLISWFVVVIVGNINVIVEVWMCLCCFQRTNSSLTFTRSHWSKMCYTKLKARYVCHDLSRISTCLFNLLSYFIILLYIVLNVFYIIIFRF